ncbi:MAG: TIGR00269 family protein [Nanoarchaeota archaeon]
MSTCRRCSKKTICSDYCKRHFFTYFENKVRDTIQKYQLIHKKDKILVGVSGGKDSLTVLHLLNQFGYSVHALAIDEGIAGYRDQTLEDAKVFCTSHKIPLKIVSYQKEYGQTLDQVMKTRTKGACSPCGTFRRNLLNKHSKGYDKMATGHNMDDEAQTILINLFKSHTHLISRQGPTTTKKKGFVPRVKPLYFMKEKEIMTYSYLKDIVTHFTECPYSHTAYRIYVRDALNHYEDQHPGTKKNLLQSHLALKKEMHPQEEKMNYCKRCGAPSSHLICQSCTYRQGF